MNQLARKEDVTPTDAFLVLLDKVASDPTVDPAKIEGLTSRYEALKRAAHKLQTVSLRGDVEAIAAYDELTLALSRLEP